MTFTKYLEDFPLLKQTDKDGRRICYLDSAATTQKPQSVIDAMSQYYQTVNANIHRGIYQIAEAATAQTEIARGKIAKFIHVASVQEIIFVRNTTEAINLVAYSWGRQNLSAGDLVILTEMEHHANIVPWQMLAAEKGIRLAFIPVCEDFSLDMETYRKLLEQRPKLVSFSAMSNVLGLIPDAKAITKAAHDAGALVLIDGAQSAAHMPIDVQDLDADFFAFSAHKMLGPTGIGVLYGKENLLAAMPPFMGGGEMIRRVTFDSFTCNSLPYKFEAGTPAIAEMIAYGTAIDYLNGIGMSAIFEHEEMLTTIALNQLSQIEGLKIFGPQELPRGGTISFTLDYAHPHDIATILDSDFVCVRAGNHCAQPLHERFGIPSTARASFYLYNSEDDIQRLIAGLEKVHRIFG